MGKKKKKPTAVGVTAPPVSCIDKRHGLLLGGILLLALALRVAGLLSLLHTDYGSVLLWDESIYHNWALEILDGHFTASGPHEFAPLPAYLMALVYWIFSPDALNFRWLNLFLGVGTCGLVYLIGRQIADSKAGLLSGFLAAVYQPFIFYSTVPLKTSLSVFLFALVLWLFLSVLTNPDPARLLGLGLASGMMINVRPNGLVVVPLMLLVLLICIFRDGRSRLAGLALAVLVLVGAAAAVSPFLALNYRETGRLALTTPQAGRNLYYANNPYNRTPYYRPLPWSSAAPVEQPVQFIIEASRRSGDRKLTPREASAFWGGQVVKYARESPAEFSAKFFRRGLAFFNGFEAGDHYHVAFLKQFIRFYQIPFPVFWLMMPLGLAGLAVTLRRNRQTLALVLFLALYAATLVLFPVNARYRLPVMAAVIPIAAAGLTWLTATLKNKRFPGIAVYSAVLASGLAMAFLPLPGAGDLTAYLNTQAWVADQKGRMEETVKWWEASVLADGDFSVFAQLCLAGYAYDNGRRDEALARLASIPENSFAAAAKHQTLGDIFSAEKNWAEAAREYRRSLAVNAAQLRTRRELIRVLEESGADGLDEEIRRLKWFSSFYASSAPTSQ